MFFMLHHLPEPIGDAEIPSYVVCNRLLFACQRKRNASVTSRNTRLF